MSDAGFLFMDMDWRRAVVLMCTEEDKVVMYT